MGTYYSIFLAVVPSKHEQYMRHVFQAVLLELEHLLELLDLIESIHDHLLYLMLAHL